MPSLDLPEIGARKPMIVAHRGASGERPEHTAAAYRLAIAQGADLIEPDLVVSKDGVLICRHENEISETTDVAARPEFSGRRTTKAIDGASVSGWFAEDFTLAELKTLRCKERLPQIRPSNAFFDGQEQILTLEEALRIAHEGGVGLCPELKHPSFFQSLGMDVTDIFDETVRLWRRRSASPRIFVQCFETEPLRRLSRLSAFASARSVQLIAADGGPADAPHLLYAAMLSDQGLADIARYAGIIGVEKSLIAPRDPAGRSLQPTDLIERAHGAGLRVFAWTFRAENYFLPAELRRGEPDAPDYLRTRGDLEAELLQFADLGVDGVFTDFTAPAAAVLR